MSVSFLEALQKILNLMHLQIRNLKSMLFIEIHIKKG